MTEWGPIAGTAGRGPAAIRLTRRYRVVTTLSLVAIAAVLGACGDIRGMRATGAGDRLVACEGTGATFPVAALSADGMTRDELAAQPYGPPMIAFFTTGYGAVESEEFDQADEFVELDTTLWGSVLLGGRSDGRVTTSFAVRRELDGWAVGGWGGCRPRRVDPPRHAAVWSPASTAGAGTAVRLVVEGGRCVGEPGTTTRVERVEVDERTDEVRITAWVVDPEPASGACAGVGAGIERVVTLAEPLGDRALLDGGAVPPTPVSAGDGPSGATAAPGGS